MFQITKNNSNLITASNSSFSLFSFFPSLSSKEIINLTSINRYASLLLFPFVAYLGLIYNFSKELRILFLKSVGHVTSIYIHNMGFHKLGLISNFSKGFRTLFLRCFLCLFLRGICLSNYHVFV